MSKDNNKEGTNIISMMPENKIMRMTGNVLEAPPSDLRIVGEKPKDPDATEYVIQMDANEYGMITILTNRGRIFQETFANDDPDDETTVWGEVEIPDFEGDAKNWKAFRPPVNQANVQAMASAAPKTPTPPENE